MFPRSWSLSRNKILRQVEQLKPAVNKQLDLEFKAQDNDAHLANEQTAVPKLKEVSPEEFVASINKLEWLEGGVPTKFVQMAEDANVWKVVLHDSDQTVIGAVGLFVDDILSTGRGKYAQLIASTLSQQWKTTKPQWLDQEGLAFHGFEIRQEGTAIILHQENVVAEMLSRYQHVEGTSKVPALKVPWPESSEDPETIKEHLKAAQNAAGELQWSVGRTRPDLQYSTMVISQLLTSNPMETCRRADVIIRYLRWSSKVGLKCDVAPDYFGKCEELTWMRDKSMLESVSDASVAPTGGRSIGAAQIFWAGSLVS